MHSFLLKSSCSGGSPDSGKGLSCMRKVLPLSKDIRNSARRIPSTPELCLKALSLQGSSAAARQQNQWLQGITQSSREKKNQLLRTSSGKFAGCGKGFSAVKASHSLPQHTDSMWWHSFQGGGRTQASSSPPLTFSDSKVDMKFLNT